MLPSEVNTQRWLPSGVPKMLRISLVVPASPHSLLTKPEQAGHERRADEVAVRRDTKEVLAELVAKLQEKLESKKEAATSGEEDERGELRPNLDRLTVGMDLGDQWSYYRILDLHGETLAGGQAGRILQPFSRVECGASGGGSGDPFGMGAGSDPRLSLTISASHPAWVDKPVAQVEVDKIDFSALASVRRAIVPAVCLDGHECPAVHSRGQHSLYSVRRHRPEHLSDTCRIGMTEVLRH
jgi:hypothetical protein